MDDTKNWYESRTVIAVLVMLAATALQQFGIELGGLEEDITSLLLDAVGVLAGGMAIWGRIVAKTKIAS
tara:strand:- start:589 stop:795 length:207 start_codon:yes stop_codon:yes gene_type:complete